MTNPAPGGPQTKTAEQKPPPEPAGSAAPGSNQINEGADVIPGLAHLAGTTLRKAVLWAAENVADTATGIVRQIAPAPVAEVVDTQVEQVRATAMQVLGLEKPAEGGVAERRHHGWSHDDLKARGDDLIARSWDGTLQPSTSAHPAFSRILDELVPDEARILRFLRVAGPQPAIDVRTKAPFGIGSERVAGGINLIADMAGCSLPGNDQVYLANLNRLGLVRFDKDWVNDPRRYALIEVQPRAMEAIESVKKAVTVYRSIHLSLFGQLFCDVCFTLEGYDAGGWREDVRGDKIVGKGPPKLKKKHH